MKKTIVYSYFFTFLLFSACSQQNTIEQGKLYDHLVLKKDTSLSYSIYVPKNISPQQQPAFIFFDPHGNGILPVKLYRNLADEFDIILIGNNNSSNNTDLNLISSGFSSLLEELKSDYKIDEKNIALWGFSGGAKAALYNAGLKNNIAYCIYGGSVMNIPDQHCELLGFNGKQDMNYTDLLAFEGEQLNNGKHFQIKFAGKHAWPDTATAKDAFRWFLLKKMQHKEMKTDMGLISSTSSAYKKELEKYISNGQFLDALIVCNKALHFLSGLTDVNYFTNKKAYIPRQPIFHTQLKALQETFKKETQNKAQYQSDLFARDTLYWKKEIDGLWAKAKTDESGMYDRLLGFLSLASYSYANRAFQANDMKAFEQILFIYHYSDPVNPEQAFLRAKLYVLKNEPEKARCLLKEAIQLGIDKNRIAGDVLLKNLQ